MKVRLFTTLGCHLCEQAHELLLSLKSDGMPIEIESVEIADSDDLMEAYGIRIPVVTTEDAREIGWPFDIVQLQTFLQQ
jgi:glutaredoxin